MWVFVNTVSIGGVNGLGAVVIILIFAGTMWFNLSTSRQTWSFARDAGLPGYKWIAKVHPKPNVPVTAVTVTWVFVILLSLINIGSNSAFNAIISLNLVSLLMTYTISIGRVLYHRLTNPQLLPKAQWSLSGWGVFINIGGVLYSFFAFS
jgi:amino acid transporter